MAECCLTPKTHLFFFPYLLNSFLQFKPALACPSPVWTAERSTVSKIMQLKAVITSFSVWTKHSWFYSPWRSYFPALPSALLLSSYFKRHAVIFFTPLSCRYQNRSECDKESSWCWAAPCTAVTWGGPQPLKQNFILHFQKWRKVWYQFRKGSNLWECFGWYLQQFRWPSNMLSLQSRDQFA